MQGVAAFAGQKRRADGLMGNLEVDASRFRTQFGFEEAMESYESVREAGLLYRIMNSEPAENR